MEEKKEQEIQLDSSKGFKYNVRITKMDNFLDAPLIKKITKGQFQLRFGGFLFGFLASILIVFVFGAFLTNNQVRAEYIWLPMILIGIGLIGIIYTMVMTDPSVGTLNKISFKMIKGLINQFKVKNGKKRDEFTGINKIEKNMIYFSNKTVGRLYRLDGKTSTMAFPSEILRQEALAVNYQNVRKANAYEIKLTSSELQNAKIQLRNLKELAEDNFDNDAIQSLATIQYNAIKERIDGVCNTVVQYLFVVADNKKMLDDYCFKLENSGLYYSMTELNDDKIKRVLSAVLNFKSIE